MTPNVFNVSYTHAAGSDQSAGRGARYITRRPDLSREDREEGREPTRESEWREIEHVGDRKRFVEEANRRRDEKRERAERDGKELSHDRSSGAAQYMHVVISPENSERMTDEDFKSIAREWMHDEAGKEYPHIGAVHRDSSHDHMHLLIARGKFGRQELEDCKDRSEEVVREIERFRGIERDTGRERDHFLGDDRERSASGERESGDHRQGMEMER
ncbi:MAG: relaxase/mobilization nuclease domain-containing protein [Rubrobacteraceae bacterium]|jgi:hypothetical protein